MPNAAPESPPPTLLSTLAARAASDPEDPWLFYRRGWDWRWRSWGQVADQVARGAEALAATEDAVAWSPKQDPDAVALSLVAQAAGSHPQTLSPSGLPECRSRLESWQPRALDLEAATETLDFQQQIFADAERFNALLEPATERPILCATPALEEPDFQVLLAWTVLAGAAWVLEPDSEAFHETVLWARPTIVAATGEELRRLTAAMQDRRRRRHSRWKVAVDVGRRPLMPLTPDPSPSHPPRPPRERGAASRPRSRTVPEGDKQ